MIKNKLSKIERDVVQYLDQHKDEKVLSIYQMEQELRIPYPIILECLYSLSDLELIAPIFTSICGSGGEPISQGLAGLLSQYCPN
jgi:hypothetical protein